MRRVSSLAVAAIAVGGFTLGVATPAAAATHNNGTLESSEFGLYYNSSLGGCVFDLGAAENDFADFRFKDPSSVNCSGEGQSTNDNTASYRNRASYTWYVWTDHFQEGTRGSLPGGYSGNASSTFKNEISSASWYIF
ncbi:hypothetical protein [Streptomyces sp. CB02400]|uniref:hypothetical protein n=1 Tax=Streptomyces sp. CB02400 TaxID=1703944 RepID=UPI00093C76C6|nr:hypothetical protein [Streptomyces sp. CB02400]OKK09991.1 hypothetical protein AMK33_13600 [Streptomyces sp. CB02400]